MEFVYRYEDAWDQEMVALTAALLAYGNVKQIKRSVADALDRVGRVTPEGPAAFVRKLKDPEFLAKADQAFSGWAHRFNVGRDLVTLWILLERSWREHGSLGAHFLSHHQPESQDIGSALDALITEWRSWEQGLKRAGRGRRTFSYLLTAPEDGSCCKRWRRCRRRFPFC